MRLPLNFLLLAAIAFGASQIAGQGLPPLGQDQNQKPAGLPPLGAPSGGLPPLGASSEHAPAGTLSVDAANSDLKIARIFNQEKRYTDAEALMLKDTAAKPSIYQLWIELGNAELGLKKYDDAEKSFNAALPSGASAQKQPVAGAFYAADNRTVGHTSGGTSNPAPKAADMREVQGAAWAGLGETYIRTNRIPDAKDAYDKAAAANPTESGLYLRNETILFLQTGNAVDQVESATKAIAVDPTRAELYFYKGQGLAAQATIDPATQKIVLPPGCADALQKYLSMEPAGHYASEAKSLLTAAGAPLPAVKK